MTRRVSLPGADELFRVTAVEPDSRAPAAPRLPERSPAAQAEGRAAPEHRQSGVGRPRHEEKVTFYCTADDLTRLERARLALRADHSLASDRGRIVRAALAEILDEFERRGEDSALVRRLVSG